MILTFLVVDTEAGVLFEEASCAANMESGSSPSNESAFA